MFISNILLTISAYISSHLSSIVLGALFLRYIISLHYSRRLPKGPCGLPLIGYLPFLGKNPHYTLWKLSKTYGSIYTIPIGKQNIVILNDWDSVRDALRKDSFLGRPDHTSFSLVTGIKSLVDDNNLSWREERRVFENIFKTCFDSPFIYRNLLTELKCLLIFLKKNNKSSIKSGEIFSTYICKFFYSFIFGKHFISATSLFDSALFVNISILSFFSSWLGKIFYKLFDIFNHYRFSLFIKFFRNQTKNHYKTIRNESSIRDLIDGYILDLQTKKSNMMVTTMTIDKLRANCQVFLSFGSEAFLAYIEWSLLSVAYFDNYQKIICNEIVNVIGTQQLPEFKHEIKMPFTLAFLNEVLRWKTVLPLNFMRRSVEDATILGHFIPRNTLILANIWAVHHDPLIWENPFQFNPYRFLTDDAKSLIDHDGFMPFSLGKRSCVAEPFVRKLLFIYFISILQKFSVSIPDSERVFDEEFNMILRPRGDLELLFELRKL